MALSSADRNKLRALRAAALGDFTAEASGSGSAEKILDRLSAARKQATKDSNKLSLASLLCVVFYLVKIAGLRADIVIFDQKIFLIPYGIFIFCVLSQLIMTLSLMRLLDARVYDRLIRGVCEMMWPSHDEFLFQTFPENGQWLEAGNSAMHSLSEYTKTRIFYSLFGTITLLLGLFVLASPILTGLYFLYDWKRQIGAGWVNLQYYSVLASTMLLIAWTVNYVLLYNADNDDS